VHVVLEGCPPGDGPYVVAECGGGLGDCLHQSATADARGTVSMYLKVQKVFRGVDCSVSPPGCSCGVYRPVGSATSAFPLGESYSVQPITFGP
jgi:hypothetical protein